MNKFNKYRSFGLIFSMTSIMSNRYDLLPDFVEGGFLGIGIVLLLIAAYAYKHDISKFRSAKINLFRKCFQKS